jgi:pimeloyl-ACP methyl ester carboxylesterase
MTTQVPVVIAGAGPFKESDSMLEVIDKGQCSQKHPVPVIFVHGAWHGAWCWEEHFLAYFAKRGYRAIALNLRGYGNSAAPQAPRRCSVADYVADICSVADMLSTPPIVIGHSLGGFIVQKYLEVRDAPAAVLLASAPVTGIAATWLRSFKRHPLRIARVFSTGTSLCEVNTPERARQAFYSPHTPEEVVARDVSRLTAERLRAAVFDMMWRRLPAPHRVRAPILVLGAEHDGSFSQDEIRATASAYDTEAEIFPAMGHNMMLEPGWAAVADRIQEWLGTHQL